MLFRNNFQWRTYFVKRWALYVGFISFSQVALVSWRIFAGSVWFKIIDTLKSHLSERHKIFEMTLKNLENDSK